MKIVGDEEQFRPRSILYGDRFRDLDYRESYFLCSQHDSKIYDFDGRVISGPRAIAPLISAEKSPIYIPLKMRRPSAPVRMGKIIVDSFTNLLFGENRFPTIKIEGDAKTQDFAQTLARVGRLPTQMIRARNLGGSVGTVGISWAFQNGVPRFEVHNAKNLFVHSWIDRVALLPKHVTEVYMFFKTAWDGKGFNKSYFWFRRDWTPNGDFVFKEVPFERDKDPVWEVDEERSSRHGDGVVHFEWVQNLPSDDIDGTPDYEGLFDQFDQLDILNSVVTRGAILNLDPTLKLKLDPDLVNRMGIRKGSDNSLVVGKDGDAEYMELAGTSIEAGTKLMELLRRSILETAQCIVPDPHEVAAQGVSSVAIKAMFAPMLSKADVLREQYAAAMVRMLENMIEVSKLRMQTSSFVPSVDPVTGQPAVDEAGQPVMEEIRFALNLPPRIEEITQADPVTGELVVSKVRVQREPGEGGEVSTVWPPYFPPTYDDQAKVVTAMQTATGGKAILSVETAVGLAAAAFGVDPAEEKKRVEGDAETANAATAAMFPPIGNPPPENVPGRGSAAPSFGTTPEADVPNAPDNPTFFPEG